MLIEISIQCLYQHFVSQPYNPSYGYLWTSPVQPSAAGAGILIAVSLN